MAVLSDQDIIEEQRADGGLTIEPFDDENVQPASYDLTLGNEWIVPVEAPPSDKPITANSGIPDSAKRVCEADTFTLDTMDAGYASFALGHVQETINLPPSITAEVKGRSSIGRLGVLPHTAGWADPGFEGQLTLEFVNCGPNPVELETGMQIAQVVFSETRSPAQTPYGQKDDAKYQGQTGVTGSRIERE